MEVAVNERVGEGGRGAAVVRSEGERFVDTYRRIGAKPFKDRVYAVV